jgi:hypothetical protein
VGRRGDGGTTSIAGGRRVATETGGEAKKGECVVEVEAER